MVAMSTQVAGMLTPERGPCTERHIGLYAPDCRGRHVLDEGQMHEYTNKQCMNEQMHG